MFWQGGQCEKDTKAWNRPPWREAAMFNKRLVLTLPARRNFRICARYYGLDSGIGSVLPVSNCVLCQDFEVVFLKNLHPRVSYLGQLHAGA